MASSRPAARRTLENALRRRGFAHVAGADEVGLGALAGPVVAAAVMLDPRRHIAGLRDSKLLTAARRERLYVDITEAACWAVASAPPDEVESPQRARRIARRAPARDTGVGAATGIRSHRRLLRARARSAAAWRGRRRPALRGHRGRLDRGQGHPGPGDGTVARTRSALWIRPAQGIRDPCAYRCRRPVRVLGRAPALVQAAHPVTRHGPRTGAALVLAPDMPGDRSPRACRCRPGRGVGGVGAVAGGDRRFARTPVWISCRSGNRTSTIALFWPWCAGAVERTRATTGARRRQRPAGCGAGRRRRRRAPEGRRALGRPYPRARSAAVDRRAVRARRGHGAAGSRFRCGRLPAGRHGVHVRIETRPAPARSRGIARHRARVRPAGPCDRWCEGGRCRGGGRDRRVRGWPVSGSFDAGHPTNAAGVFESGYRRCGQRLTGEEPSTNTSERVLWLTLLQSRSASCCATRARRAA